MNLPNSLSSVRAWARGVFVVDSFSLDQTVEIACEHGAAVYSHPFEHWSSQRNWALENLPIETDWALFLDADEVATEELLAEIDRVLPEVPAKVGGFYIPRKFIFLERWLRRGGLWPNPVLRLVRAKGTHVERVGTWEYFQVPGRVDTLANPILHRDRRGITHWIEKHNRYATWEAEALAGKGIQWVVPADGNILERSSRLWLRKNVWMHLPLFARPICLFAYAYFLQFGFLDGIPGAIYALMHSFWYPLLVAVKVLENERARWRCVGLGKGKSGEEGDRTCSAEDITGSSRGEGPRFL